MCTCVTVTDRGRWWGCSGLEERKRGQGGAQITFIFQADRKFLHAIALYSHYFFFSSSSSKTRKLECLFQKTDSKVDETGSRTLPGNRPAAGTCEDGEVCSPTSNNSQPVSISTHVSTVIFVLA